MPIRKSLRDFGSANRFQRIERRFLRTLLIGFGLVLVAMVASGVMGLRALDQMRDETGRLAEYFVQESSLLDDLVRHQANLGVLLYGMAERKPGKNLKAEVQTLRGLIGANTRQALKQETRPDELAAWQDVDLRAGALFEEVHTLLATGQNNSPKLSNLHRAFIASVAGIMDTSLGEVSASRSDHFRKSSAEMDASRRLFLVAFGLAALGAAASIAACIALFHRLEKYADSLAMLSRHALAEQEDSARRFSQDMHDEFGQSLNAVESTLSVVQAGDAASAERLADAIAMVKEAQSTAREMSQLLRPRILDDFGLDAGLRELARGYSKRTGIVVDYRSNTRERLEPEVETQLFRIAQEALTNTSRHTTASMAELVLHRAHGAVTLTVSDNGGGFPAGSLARGLGLLGMQERARAAHGSLNVESTPGKGVEIRATVPAGGQP